MFDLTSHNRKSLHFQTALLEASDWSESEVDRVLTLTGEILEQLRIPDIPCPLDFYLEKSVKPALISQNIYENQADVIINFIRHDAEFVRWMMSAEEN